MNKSFNTKLGLVTVAVLSGIVLTSQLPVNAKAETPVMAASAQQGFHFVATVVDSQTRVLPGKLVTLSEVTSIIASVKTNDAGQAIFNNLPIKRNLSVSVDGQVKGYTIRTDVAGSSKAASFTATGVGTNEPTYSKKTIDITVRDQNAEPVSGRTVTLKTQAGREIASLVSGDNGLTRFTDRLLDGTFYQYFVDGKKIGDIVPGESRSAYVNVAPKKDYFTFTVTALDKDGLVVKGKEVTLTDITDGKAVALASLKTNDNGQAIFTNLPLSRNISVSIDGKSKGYTLRTDVAGSHKAAAFYVDGKGTKAPQFSAEAAVVTVYDANGNTIANQEVTLTNSNGTIVAKGLTEKDGKARFANKLMAGTLYNIFVNGIEMSKTALVGSDVSVFLTDKQIKKEKPVTPDKLDKEMNQEKEKELLDTPKPVPPTSKPTAPIKNKKDDSPKKFTKSQSSSLKSSVKAIGAKPKAMTALAKKLPKTGDQAISILTLVGFIVTGLAIMLGFLKKSRSK
ncbi:LPXTG cell wall anchor domain-containing protein [Streptococcus agalactiae]|uniref:LPXTG cell wall anchor domain-containing protein n=1 Tax=Streptococcus agalactiae TaxID=1311 RepID=UPI001374A64E|nr:LPXTG cell wall anchor domain-containing protein [Streptococcus agalactiae]KAF1246031.1 cell surface protein [Streptococcus agalactiae]